MSEEAKKWFDQEQMEYDFDDFIYVGTYGEYGGRTGEKFYECLKSYSDHRLREVLEKAEKEIEIEFPTSPNALIIGTNDHNKSGAKWLLEHLKQKLPNNIQER